MSVQQTGLALHYGFFWNCDRHRRPVSGVPTWFLQAGEPTKQAGLKSQLKVLHLNLQHVRSVCHQNGSTLCFLRRFLKGTQFSKLPDRINPPNGRILLFSKQLICHGKTAARVLHWAIGADACTGFLGGSGLLCWNLTELALIWAPAVANRCTGEPGVQRMSIIGWDNLQETWWN